MRTMSREEKEARPLRRAAMTDMQQQDGQAGGGRKQPARPVTIVKGLPGKQGPTSQVSKTSKLKAKEKNPPRTLSTPACPTF